MLNALKSTGKSVRGVRYELEGAAYLIRNPGQGETVIEVTRKFRSGLKGGTDFDVVVRKGDDDIFYQFKSSNESFKSPMVGKTIAWIGKVSDHIELSIRETVTAGQVRFAVPDLNMIPPSVQKNALNANSIAPGIPAIPTPDIPITP